jgi:hypothetical protein
LRDSIAASDRDDYGRCVRLFDIRSEIETDEGNLKASLPRSGGRKRLIFQSRPDMASFNLWQLLWK